MPDLTLLQIPVLSSQESTSAWATQATWPTTPMAWIHVADDDIESIHSIPDLGTLPIHVQVWTVGEGQSPFDCDIAGARYPHRDTLPVNSISQHRLNRNMQWTPLVAENNYVPQEAVEAKQADPLSL